MIVWYQRLSLYFDRYATKYDCGDRYNSKYDYG